MKLTAVWEYPYEIECLSGLHVGTGKSLGIGGCDNLFLRHPLTGEPYVPGSTVKGRARFLVEKARGWDDENPSGNAEKCAHRNESPCRDCGLTLVCKCFGSLRRSDVFGSTRFLFGDARLDGKWLKEAFGCGWDEMLAEGRDLAFWEHKTETAISRRTGTVLGRTLRTTERVPAGTRFKGSVRVAEFEGDDLAEMEGLLSESFRLLQAFYIGGGGSRGYGWVKISFDSGRKKQLF